MYVYNNGTTQQNMFYIKTVKTEMLYLPLFFYTMNMYGYSFYIPHIFHTYIYIYIYICMS